MTTENSEKTTVTTYDYEKDGAAIYRQSFATIRAEADLADLPADVSQVAVRMIHACGMVDLVRDLAYTPDVALALFEPRQRIVFCRSDRYEIAQTLGETTA